MDSIVSENEEPRPLRRSTRQSSVKVFSYEPTPRDPLKRTKRRLENQIPDAVNGSRDVQTGTEDEESPNKKSRLEAAEAVGGSGDDDEMDVDESGEDPEKNKDQEMDTPQDPSHGTHKPNTCQGAIGDVILLPRVMLGERCRLSHAKNEDADCLKTKTVRPSTKGPGVPTRPAALIKAPVGREVLTSKITSMDEYKKKMDVKAKSSDVPIANHHVLSGYLASEKFSTGRQYVKSIPTQKNTGQHKKQEIKKPTVIKRRSGSSCRGLMWYLCRWVLLGLLSYAALLGYKNSPVLQRTVGGVGHPPRAVDPETFADHLSLLETRFPSQRAELWKRSKIHLERHLKTAQPTEPVSLIFAAGRRAERTLQCLARGLAASFSSALNASVLHIDGASKSNQDGDEVKLDIDGQLKAAFEGDKPAAVIHRFEELPPGSTLIFYRYCDHENAAYKRAFLLFTVLLLQDDVGSEQSLKEVEETVQDYVREKLVSSSNQAGFNKMDGDKYGGLWSRISHLILPVVSEKEIEQRGC